MENTYSNWTSSDAKRRSKDELQEKVVGNFLDKYYYSTFTTSIKRNTDKETQIKGLDLTITSTNNNTYTIDEKAAVKWANKGLMTFAFEVDSLDKNGNLYNGWLMTNTAINDYWLLTWIDSATTADFTSVDELKAVTVALVKKTDLYNWMHKKHITGEALKQAAIDLRTNFNYNNGCTYTRINGLKVTIQPNVCEHATNILLPRTALINEIATYSASVTDKGITPIKRNIGI